MGQSVILRSALIGACVPLLTAAGLAPAAAQERSGGLQQFITLEQQLEAGRNLDLDVPADGTSTIARTLLSYGLLSETSTQRFRFDTSGELRITSESGEDTEVEVGAPDLRFSYEREGARAGLQASANWRRSSVDWFRDLSDFVNEEGQIELPEDFGAISGEGDRTDYGARIAMDFGRDMPLGYFFSAERTGIDYTDTTDPDLYDIERTRLAAGVRLTFSPVTTATLELRHARYEAEDIDETDRKTDTIDLGLEMALSPRATLDLGLGYTRVRTEEVGGTERVSGGIGGVGLVYEMPNGQITAAFDSLLDQNGRRSEFVLGRSLELPRGRLAASIGASKFEDEDAELIGSLAWIHDLPDGQISVRFDRSVSLNSDDENQLFTGLAASWRQEINALSSYGLGFTYALSDQTAENDRVERIDLNATYSYALTPDWNLNAGLNYRTRKEGTEARAESPSVFVSLARTFEF